ncbi:MAG: DUF2752 domain-containing protein [Planctomycetaceae bacterium]|nr:DUF2752 domain-containing protein [Planctomycetaceae bacterium]
MLTFVLRTFPDGRVGLSGLPQFPLPELCGSRALFGVDCPGCGLTRSILALGRGDWSRSVQYHRIGWIMALAIALQIPYRLYYLITRPNQPRDVTLANWLGTLLITLLIGNWAVAMLFGI